MRSASRPLAVLALAAALPLAGCILEDDSDRRPIVNETIVYNSGIQSAVFQFDAFDVTYTTPDQGAYVEYQTNLIDQDTYEAGMVLLYADGALINGIEGESWSALPLTFGTDLDEDGLVDVTTAFGYTFRPNVIAIELQASSPLPVSEGGTDRGFDFLGVLDMRLVTIPPGEFLRAEGLDFTDYEAVQRFYGLPN